MTLELPVDIEKFGTDYTNAGIYTLELAKPRDLEAAWDREFDTRPSWFNQLADARRVLYVGAASNVIARLEDHREGNVRLTVLTRVCDVVDVIDVDYYDDANRAFENEWNRATEVDRLTSANTFVLNDGEPV